MRRKPAGRRTSGASSLGRRPPSWRRNLALAGLVIAVDVVSLYNMDAFNALYYTLLGFVLLRFGCWLYVRRKY